MSLELKIISIMLSIVVLIAIYVGIIKSSNFKGLSEEKQKSGIKRLKFGMVICWFFGVFGVFDVVIME